jgi:hypothetical protein
MVQPVSQIDTTIREDGPVVHCTQHIGGRHDCPEQGYHYLWIST